MKAIGYRCKGDIDVLQEIELPTPTPGTRDLLVAVKAMSVNPVDTKRRFLFDPSPNAEYAVLGYDAAGIVEAVGPEVTLFKAGDEVYYAGHLDRPGSNAEYQTVDERIVGLKPKRLSFGEAAALPLTAITAWEILFDRMKLSPNLKDSSGNLLVLNGAGGVGSMMIQLARRLTGLTIIATASRAETRDWVLGLGAHFAVNHRKPIDQEIRDIGVQGLDYVAGITTTPESIAGVTAAMNPQSHISLIDDFDQSIRPFFWKSITISCETMLRAPCSELPT